MTTSFVTTFFFCFHQQHWLILLTGFLSWSEMLKTFYFLFFTCILTLVTQPLSLQSTVSGTSAPDAPAKGDGALWMSVGGLSVAKDCRISSGVCEEVNNKWWNEQHLFSRLSSPKVTSANAFYLCKRQSKTQRFRTFSSPLYYITYIFISHLIF